MSQPRRSSPCTDCMAEIRIRQVSRRILGTDRDRHGRTYRSRQAWLRPAESLESVETEVEVAAEFLDR